jgi:hypothetical protein
MRKSPCYSATYWRVAGRWPSFRCPLEFSARGKGPARLTQRPALCAAATGCQPNCGYIYIYIYIYISYIVCRSVHDRSVVLSTLRIPPAVGLFDWCVLQGSCLSWGWMSRVMIWFRLLFIFHFCGQFCMVRCSWRFSEAVTVSAWVANMAVSSANVPIFVSLDVCRSDLYTMYSRVCKPTHFSISLLDALALSTLYIFLSPLPSSHPPLSTLLRPLILFATR